MCKCKAYQNYWLLGHILMLVIRERRHQKNRGQVMAIYYLGAASSTVPFLVFNSLAEVCATQTMTWVIDTGL